MKQEWFESNDFVKATSKNKPEEQTQEVADKAEETIANLDTPIEKNTQVEEEVSQEIQREALLFIDNALTYKDLLTDYFEERELLLSNSKRMIAPILIKNLDDEIQTR